MNTATNVDLGETYFSYHDAPVGRLRLSGCNGALTGLHFDAHAKTPVLLDNVARNDDRFDDVRTQLDAYFAGSRTAFDLEMSPVGTDFQREVWRELERVPYAETATYAQIAARIGRPSAMRAVGAANGKNPISIVVPCHRVIGADGSLTGYAWGVDKKTWLLDHERRVAGISMI